MGNPYHTSNGQFAKRPDGIAPVRKARAPTVKTDWAPTDELGRQQKQRYGSNLFDDFLPQLRGSNALRVWREMTDNDATIGAILFAIEMLLRQAVWTAEPASDSPADGKAALFVDECAGDMQHTWPDHVSAALTMLPFGFSWFEQVFRVRRQESGSQFNDGKLGWKHFGFRPQDTLNRWEFRDDGSVAAFVQDTGSDLVSIPADKSVHYRTTVGRGVPEGRALALDTPLPTPDGWRSIGELTIGDRVFDEKGMIRHVTGVADWVDRPCYRMGFSDGSSVVADAAHQWLTQTAKERYGRKPARIRSTEQIALTASGLGGRVSNHAVSWAQALRYPTQHLLVHPYMLGLWLGDGNTLSANISCHVQDLDDTVALIEGCGCPTKTMQNGVQGCNGRTIRVYGGLQSLLRVLGVLGDKHIPSEYLRGDPRQRADLLAGLLDSDGCCDRWGRVEFVNTNRNLIDGVTELVRSLGMSATTGLKAHANGKDRKQDAWVVRFTPTVSPFRLPRKAARTHLARARQFHYMRRVEPAPNQDTRCIEVDSPSHLFLVGEGMVPTHNSILRNAYRSWFFKKRSEEILLIGEERALAGLPVMQIPAESIISGDAAYTRYATLVRRVKQDEQMGVIIPSDLWPNTSEPMFKFDTLKSEGPRSLDPVEVVRMFAGDIAASVLAGFIYLGRDAVGSRALASPMQELFQKALESWLDSMEDTFHHQAVVPLLKLNGFQTVTPPRWRHGSVADVDLVELGQFIQQVSASGYDWGVLNEADPIRDQIRTMAGFEPEPKALSKSKVRKRWDQGKQLWLLP